ncbi:MAG: TadE family protein [Anaerolineae bacterium]
MSRNQSFTRRMQRLEKGQSLVEMTVGFVVLVVILSGLLDLGRIYFIYVALEDGAGEGAIYLSINPACRTASDGAACANDANAEWRARNAGGQFVDWTAANVVIKRPSVFGVGDPVSVTIEYSFRLLTPVMPQITGLNPLTLRVTADQTIIKE